MEICTANDISPFNLGSWRIMLDAIQWHANAAFPASFTDICFTRQYWRHFSFPTATMEHKDFDWSILEDKDLEPSCVCGHLQLLFALLQFSERRWIKYSSFPRFCLREEKSRVRCYVSFSSFLYSFHAVDYNGWNLGKVWMFVTMVEVFQFLVIGFKNSQKLWKLNTLCFHCI